MPDCDYIAVDWGTTNRRIYAMRNDGSTAYTGRDGLGVLAVPHGGFAGEFESIRGSLGDMPIIAAGMIGSDRGLENVPYCAAPATLADLAAGTVEVLDRVRIVPGVSLVGADTADVMRGEEVQVLGALAGGQVSGSALFCQPGTHNKWITAEEDRIVSFATAMTGELFALLKERSILSEMLAGDVSDGAAFREGLDRGAGCQDLPTALFQARAAVLLRARSIQDTASYVSGVLIGADVGSRKDLSGREVILLSSGGLADLYGVAIRRAGASLRAIDSHAAFAAGIHAIKEQLS